MSIRFLLINRAYTSQNPQKSTNAANAGDVIAAGADGVAVISALSLAPDPAKAAQDLRTVVETALARGGRS